MGERATREFEEICRERGVVGGLNELERLVGEGEGRRDRVLREGGEGEEDGGEEEKKLIP